MSKLDDDTDDGMQWDFTEILQSAQSTKDLIVAAFVQRTSQSDRNSNVSNTTGPRSSILGNMLRSSITGSMFERPSTADNSMMMRQSEAKMIARPSRGNNLTSLMGTMDDSGLAEIEGRMSVSGIRLSEVSLSSNGGKNARESMSNIENGGVELESLISK